MKPMQLILSFISLIILLEVANGITAHKIVDKPELKPEVSEKRREGY